MAFGGGKFQCPGRSVRQLDCMDAESIQKDSGPGGGGRGRGERDTQSRSAHLVCLGSGGVGCLWECLRWLLTRDLRRRHYTGWCQGISGPPQFMDGQFQALPAHVYMSSEGMWSMRVCTCRCTHVSGQMQIHTRVCANADAHTCLCRWEYTLRCSSSGTPHISFVTGVFRCLHLAKLTMLAGQVGPRICLCPRLQPWD